MGTSLASVRLNNIVMAACTGLEYGGGLLLLVLSPGVFVRVFVGCGGRLNGKVQTIN